MLLLMQQQLHKLFQYEPRTHHAAGQMHVVALVAMALLAGACLLASSDPVARALQYVANAVEQVTSAAPAAVSAALSAALSFAGWWT